MEDLVNLLKTGDQEGMSISELSSAANCHPNTMRNGIRRMIAEGKVALGFAKRHDMIGILRRTPVYRWIGGKK